MNRQSVREKQGICGICSAGCWIKARYGNDGRIIEIEPDTSSEMGILCRLGEHAPDIIYSPDRLLYPLKRKGEKGTLDFERISWDQAFETIASRMLDIRDKHGPEAAAVYTGVGTFETSLCDIFQPRGVRVSSASSVLFPFGSPNTMGVGALCYVSYGMIAPHVTFGEMLVDMFNDIENSELIVVWGANPATDLPPVDMNRIVEAHARGAAIVVIDPRQTLSARLDGAVWLPIRPGTDGALALGLCSVIIEEELYDEEFVTRWTTGFEEFARYTRNFTPESVSNITGIPAHDIRELARRLSRARGASQLMYTGLEYSPGGVQAIRASFILWAISGQLDVPGGRCFSMKGNAFPVNRNGHLPVPTGVKRLGDERFPVYAHYREEAHAMALPDSVLHGKPYKIRSLIIQGASIITSWPNPALWKETLGSLDFLVCIDRNLTADSAYADIVLPATTYFENRSYVVYGPLFRIRERMIEPLGESRSDYLIMAELAARLGYGHLYPGDEDEVLRHVLRGSGFSLEDVEAEGGMVSVDTSIMQYRKWEKGLLRPDNRPGFNTPSGKFEISSSVLGEYGYDPLPVYTEPLESPLSRPDLTSDYPIVFDSGSRIGTGFHTQHHGIPAFALERPEPSVTINTGDAIELGIKNGGLARITTPRGSLCMRARVTENIMRGVIDANHGCGSPSGPVSWRDRNINYLTDIGQYDPISGFPVYKSLLCSLSPEKINGDPVKMDSGELSFEDIETNKNAIEQKEIYLDNNATTALSNDVKKAMTEAMELYGNPSSIHDPGRKSRDLVEDARRAVASALNCTARRIIFTGSGTESNNIAIKGAALSAPPGKNHIITSSVEHASVLESCRWLERHGFRITCLKVDAFGMVSPDDLEKAITAETFLVSIMSANNETGTIQPVRKLAGIAAQSNLLFHCDAVQSFGKIPLDPAELGVDLMTLSAHKIHGPRGTGALYISKEIKIDEFLSGGGHESGLRPGTENTVGIAGFGRAAAEVPELLRKMGRVQNLRDILETGINRIVNSSHLNGHRDMRLPNTINMTLPGYRGESVVLEMNRRGIYFSAGSACGSGTPEPSHALTAMGLSSEEAHCSIRISLSHETDEDDIATALRSLEDTFVSTRKIVHFVPCR